MISLYGALARRFEKKYNTSAKNINIRVTSVTEMMMAMEANFKGFRAMLKRKGYYRVVRGQALTHGKDIDPVEIEMNFSEKNWHIMPVAAGCKKNGIMNVIVGAVLIVAGVVLRNPALIQSGFAMALGGVAQMLAPSPGAGNYADRERPEERPSYLSSAPVNAVEPGLTLPVCYGDVWCGSITVSGGLKMEDI